MASVTDMVKAIVAKSVNDASKVATGTVSRKTSTGGTSGSGTVIGGSGTVIGGTNKNLTSTPSGGAAAGGGTDWSSQMQSAMDRGASADVVEYLMNQRNNKIAANQAHYDALGISGNDSISQAAQQYIDQKRQEEQAAQYGSFEDFLSGTGYDQYAEQTQAAIKAAVQNAVNGYRGQIDTTNQDSDKLARQAYIAKMLGQKNLGQQMAAGGYAGGMADSQRIATETDYQNQLSEIEKQRLATVKELESAITNAQLTGDMQTAQELASYLQNIQSQWASYVQSRQQMAQQNYWNQKQLDNQNYWNEQDLAMQNQESARSWAMQQMAKGILPDDETLTAAGISKQAAQQQVALVLGQNGAGTVTQPTQQTVRRTSTGGGYNNGRLTSSQVMQLQKALGVTADGLWGSNSQAAAGGMTADQAWEAYQQNNPGTSRFSGLAYQTMIQNKQYDQADAYLAQFWDTMSTADRTRANIIANKYGPK